MANYIFNYNGNPKLPQCNEENIFTNIYCNLSNISHINIYNFNKTHITNKQIINICEDINILLISTTNSAHSISEIISFLNYYKNNNYQNKIAIYKNIINKMPFMYELILLFIPLDKIIILYDTHSYNFSKLITYRNHHFNYTKEWENVEFIKKDNILYFENLQYLKNTFSCDSIFIFDKVLEIYNSHKNNYELYDNIMIIKTNDIKCTTPDRGFDTLTDNICNTYKENNIKILKILDFKDIYHYICVLFHSKNIIFSYGGPACTNRFFCNPESNIIVLANKHYRHEYEYGHTIDNQNYWHVRHSHLHPVKKQTFLLDFDNYIDTENIKQILSFILI
jgi:hypothetical protein